jgi:hypothetical protein
MVKKPDLRGGRDLRGLTVVIVNNASEYVATSHRTGANRRWIRNRNLLVDALVGTGGVMVNNELPHHTSQMGLIDDQQFIQTLVSDRANPVGVT